MNELRRAQLSEFYAVDRAFLLREEMIHDSTAKGSELNLKSFMREAMDIAESEGTANQISNMYSCISMLAKHANELRDIEYSLKGAEAHHPIDSLRKGKVRITFTIFRLIQEIKHS